MGSDKTGFRVLLVTILALAASGCGERASEADGFSRNRESSAGGVREPGDLDLGEDWDDSWIDDLAPGQRTAATGDGRASAGIAGTRRTYWGVVLGTYASEGHVEAATNMIKSCAAIDPRLASSHVHTTQKGSMVVYGVYDKADSPQAQADLKWIKSLTGRGRTVFPRAILSRIQVGPDPQQFVEGSLLAARRQYPNVNPLYTLEVAVWGDFGDSSISLEDVRRRGEAYARELRGQGMEAYFHHDDDLRLTMVTVGLFGHSAVDPQSGLLAPEVEELLRRFPAHLVNGEELNEPIDSRRPQLGTRVQQPRLVFVPDL